MGTGLGITAVCNNGERSQRGWEGDRTERAPIKVAGDLGVKKGLLGASGCLLLRVVCAVQTFRGP